MSKSSVSKENNMAAKSRKANWTDAEIKCLVSECTDGIRLITAKHGDGTEKQKGVYWVKLTDRINSVGGSSRTVEEVTKKWKDLKSQTKKKEQARRREVGKTGGGGVVSSLKDWEEKIITIIPSSVIEGVSGGTDLFERSGEEGSTETASCSQGVSDTVVHVGTDDKVLASPSNIHVQVERRQKELQKECSSTHEQCRKRKRSLSDIQEAQYQFYIENADLCRAQKKLAEQQCRTLAVQEQFYKNATLKMNANEDIASFLNTYIEQ